MRVEFIFIGVIVAAMVASWMYQLGREHAQKRRDELANLNEDLLDFVQHIGAASKYGQWQKDRDEKRNGERALLSGRLMNITKRN